MLIEIFYFFYSIIIIIIFIIIIIIIILYIFIIIFILLSSFKSYASKLTRGHNQARLITPMSKVGYKQNYIEWTDSEDDDEAAFFSD